MLALNGRQVDATGEFADDMPSSDTRIVMNGLSETLEQESMGSAEMVRPWLSIISWDCCYRNFFGLIDSFAVPSDEHRGIELIFVEQRNADLSVQANHWAGLESLGEIVARVKKTSLADVQVRYLGDEETVAYNVGRAVNHGLEFARGEWIAVMDGDLVPEIGFFRMLQAVVEKGPGIWVGHRKTARYPVGVDRFADWKSAARDHRSVIRACVDASCLPGSRDPINNFGPMLCAPAREFRRVSGYDASVHFATAASTVHYDAAARLSLSLGKRAALVPFFSLAHPWHPTGANSDPELGERVRRLLVTQRGMSKWAQEHQEADWRTRQSCFIDTERAASEDVGAIEKLDARIRSEMPSENPADFIAAVTAVAKKQRTALPRVVVRNLVAAIREPKLFWMAMRWKVSNPHP